MAVPSTPVDFNQKAIESELFRFVSVRNPQRMPQAAHALLTIPFTFQASSSQYAAYLGAINDTANDTPAAKLSALKAIAESYQAGSEWVADQDALETLVPSFSGLGDWLIANFESLSVASVSTRMSEVVAPSETVLVQIWDNLFARLILGANGTSCAGIMEVLLLHHLLIGYANVVSEEELRLLANARVILPKAIFPLPGINIAEPVAMIDPVDRNAEVREKQRRTIAFLQKALEELDELRSQLREAIECLPIAPVVGAMTITAETVFPTYNFVLSEAEFGELSGDSQGILTEYKLGAGSRLSYCMSVLVKKLAKLSVEYFNGGGIGAKVVATGGAIWEQNAHKEEEEAPCIPSRIPNTGSAEVYQAFYGQDAKCRIKPLGVGDLMVLKQKLCCYAPSEVAHIENVMQGEYKERVTRRLRRTEDTFTSITSKETTNERDTITTEQYEMQKASSNVVQQDMSFNVGMSAGHHGKIVDFTVTSGFGISNSTSTAQSSATNYAQSVTTRALQRVVERTYEERVHKVIDEYEETNTHGLDNSAGTAHVVGLFRWVDKIYKAHVENYGKRLMFEFMIPEPGAFHLWAMSKPSAINSVQLVVPIDPRTPAVTTFPGLQPLTELTINETNYAAWAAAYGVTLDTPPVDHQIISMSHAADEIEPNVPFARSWPDLNVPSGYRAVSWNCFEVHDVSMGHWVTVTIGTNTAFTNLTNIGNASGNFMGNVVGSIPVSIAGVSQFFTLNVHIWCEVMQNTMRDWQKDCYAKVMDAYLQQQSAYDQALSEAKSGFGSGFFGTNPAINREIEKNELRKACLNALFYGADFSSDSIANFGSYDDCKPPIALTDCCAVYQGERAKFLEQVFDWEFMGYEFYPYFHAQRCRWKMLYQLQDSDPDFLKFLQAGMGRVLVPVKPGFEETALYFLSTGQIWSGGPAPGVDSALFEYIVKDVRSLENGATPWSSKEWEIRVPTTLTVLQCQSGCASGDGLPCDCGTGVGTGTQVPMVGGAEVNDPTGGS